MSDPNYPDDIHQYDSHPDSPFHRPTYTCGDCFLFETVACPMEWVEEMTKPCAEFEEG